MNKKYVVVYLLHFLLKIIMQNIFYFLFQRYTSVPLFFKCVEILLIIVFIILYVLGRILKVGLIFSPYTGKVILCFGLLYFFYRLIAVYLPISPTLGPLLYRVRLMVSESFRVICNKHPLNILKLEFLYENSVYSYFI